MDHTASDKKHPVRELSQTTNEPQKKAGRDRENNEKAAIAWAISAALISIAWATSSYLMVREKQRAQVELARLELEAKKFTG